MGRPAAVPRGEGRPGVDGRPLAAGWLADSADKRHLLPFRPMVFHLAWLSGGLLAAIFALELAARRLWCRYLCPAGALLGLFGRRPLLKRVPAKVCNPAAIVPQRAGWAR